MIKEYKFGVSGIGKHVILDTFGQGCDEDYMYNYQHHSIDEFRKNLEEYMPHIELIEGVSTLPASFASLLSHEYSCIFIDGDHQYPEVLQDMIEAQMVTNNIFGHDYGHPGVTRSVDLFCARFGYVVDHWKPPYGLFSLRKQNA